MSTLVFLSLLKQKYYSLLNYFIVQELGGILFLILRISTLSVWFIFLKVGVSPLHFWVFSVVSSLKDWILVWFNSIQKLPYLSPLFLLFFYSSLITLLIGSLIILHQLILVKRFYLILTLSSIESFNTLLIYSQEDSFSSLIIIIIYWFLNWFILSFNSLNSSLLTVEIVLWMIRFPLGLSFIFKFFIISGLSMRNWGFLLLLLTFLSFITIIWIILIIHFSIQKSNNLSIVQLIIIFFVLLVIFF